MGYERREITISVRLSRHNDEHDDRDEALLFGLREKVRGVLQEPQYQAIEPEMWP